MARKPKPSPPPPPTRYEFDTFQKLSSFNVHNLTQPDPYCWNGIVSIRKWRVTFEQLDEPKEILVERLRKLWRENDNMHHTGPLLAVARSLGIELSWDEHRKDARSRYGA